MKIRELLKDLDGKNRIVVSDIWGVEYEIPNPQAAIINYGHYTIKNWFAYDNVIHINIQSEF